MVATTTRRRPSLRTRVHRTKRALQTATRRSEATWRLTFNLPRTISLGAHRRFRAQADEDVLDALHHDGIALSDVDSFFQGDTEAFERVRQRAVAWADDIRADDVLVLDDDATSGRKGYVHHAVPNPTFVRRPDRCTRPPDEIAALALHPVLVATASRYLGLSAELVSYDLWLNRPTAEERYSQLWHRDPEDRKIVRVFMALEPIAEPNGPFSYAAGSHPAARGESLVGTAFGPRIGPELRLTNDEMATLVPEDRWVRHTGPTGRIAIADTAGYHRGACRSEDRLLFICTFASAVSKRGVSGILRDEPIAAAPAATSLEPMG